MAYLRRAVFLHRREGKADPPVVIDDWSSHPKGSPREPYKRDDVIVIPCPERIRIPDELFYARFREELLKDRFALAAKTGIPELAYLDKLRPTGMSIRLSRLFDMWSNKSPKPTVKTINESRSLWNEFLAIVAVDRASELTNRRAFSQVPQCDTSRQ